MEMKRMVRNTIIAALYLSGAFVSGGYYHRDATNLCFSGVFGKTVVIMVIWPIMAPQIMLGGLEGGCDK